MKYLFPNFLINKFEYQICKNYWEVKIEYLLQKYNISDMEQYLNTKFANGKEQFNGNPIVNYYVKSKNKALRIILEEPETEYIDESRCDRVSSAVEGLHHDHTESVEDVPIADDAQTVGGEGDHGIRS